MLILNAGIFEKYPEIIFGFNTKIGNDRKAPYYFNVSHSVGDDEKIVNENRKLFMAALQLNSNSVALQRQVHGVEITYVDKPGNVGESDAMITDVPNLALAISTADCSAIFIYDPVNKVIAGVHSGWRGTEKKILLRTLQKLKDDFKSDPYNLTSYIAPSISQKNYEVGKDVAGLFNKKYLLPKGNKFLLDVAGANYDMLIDFGLNPANVERSRLCSFEQKGLLHSFRRDGLHSGRSWGVIAVKK